VVYRVRDAAWDDWTPGTQDPTIANRRPEGAGHALAGPVWVEGAEPGDALAVGVREMVCRDWAFGVHRPGKAEISGVLADQPDDVREDFLNHFHLDRQAEAWRFNERISVPHAPFMGIFGVAPAEEGRTPTFHPGPHGGNIDCKELTEGATVFLPVFVPGALFSVGDGHGAQGDGEVDGAAVETGMDRLVLDFGLRKGADLKRPRAETEAHLIFLAFDEDLDVAVLEATRDVLDYLTLRQGLTHHEAYNLASIAVDFRVTQVVDGLKGVHAMLPKNLFADGPPSFFQ
jgi:acetamidase/formamidase